jgi:hypothetical protein
LHLEDFEGEAAAGVVSVILDDHPSEAVLKIDLCPAVDVDEEVFSFKELVIAVFRPTSELRTFREEC